jgi:hypothetical protein
MNAIRIVAALWFGIAFQAAAQSGVEKYSTDPAAYEAKLPLYCSSLREFVEVGRAVAYSDSFDSVVEVWRRHRAKQAAGKASNAWVEIDDRGAAVCAEWKIDEPVAEGKTTKKVAPPIRKDELPLLEALQRYSIKETGFPKVVAMEVRMVTWDGFPNATLAITHNRFAMSWHVHSRDGEKKAQHWLLVFLAKPKEAGKTLGKNGLKLLHIYEDKVDDDEWSLIIDDRGASKDQ